MSDDEDSDKFVQDFKEVHKQIQKFKCDPSTAGMFVSGWDDPEADEGVETCKNPTKNPKEHILWAAENGDLEKVIDLTEQDSSLIHAQDDDNYTPLHRAAYSNHVDIISYLLSRGASTGMRTVDGWQPLHSACNWNNYKAVARLLAGGADVNARTEGNQTPLHIASSISHCKSTLILLLMRPNIDPDVLNNSNEKALELARRKGIYDALYEMVEPCVRYIKSVEFTHNPYWREHECEEDG